jgi:hypothetical protein
MRHVLGYAAGARSVRALPLRRPGALGGSPACLRRKARSGRFGSSATGRSRS